MLCFHKNASFKIILMKANEVATDDALDKSDSKDDEKLSFFTNKFKRTLKKHGNFGRNKKFKPRYEKESKEKVMCYDCRKPSHFIVECSQQDNKEKDKKKWLAQCNFHMFYHYISS